MLPRLRAMCALVVVNVGVPTVRPVVFPWVFLLLSSNWKLEFSASPLSSTLFTYIHDQGKGLKRQKEGAYSHRSLPYHPG